jgi:putative aldouronate transport system substrate-binding protein
MKAKIKIGMLLLSGLMFVSSLTACGGGSGSKNGDASSSQGSKVKAPDSVELKVFFFGEDGKHYRAVDPILSEFQKKTKDTLNTTLKITWTPPADYKQKLPMMVAAGEDMDLVFDAGFMNLNQLAKNGAYADLGSYFNNDKYPNLKKNFSKDYIDSNKIYGKTYAIPITNAFMDMEGVVYRKDLLAKYGLKSMSSYDDLYALLTKAQEIDKIAYPYGSYAKDGFFKLFYESDSRNLEGNVYTVTGAPSYINVSFSKDGKTLNGVAAMGDPDSEWKNFDTKYGKAAYENYFAMARKFNKFISPDVLTNTNLPSIVQGKVVAQFDTISKYMNDSNQLKAVVPSAELGFWPIYSNNASMTPGSKPTDYKAWNFACVPTVSKKVDRTMQFMDWLFASRENNDLFTYGIQGKNWEPVGNDQYKIPSGVDPNSNYLFPGYQMTWNPNFTRIPAGLPDDVLKWTQWQYKADTYKASPLVGFSFDQSPIQTDLAKLNAVSDKYWQPLESGMFSDPNATIEKMNKELKDAGLDKVKAEVKKQLEAFLANKK